MPDNNAAEPASTTNSHTGHTTVNGTGDNNPNNASAQQSSGPRLSEYQGPTTLASRAQWGTLGNQGDSGSLGHPDNSGTSTVSTRRR
jgi:hypothetical protein